MYLWLLLSLMFCVLVHEIYDIIKIVKFRKIFIQKNQIDISAIKLHSVFVEFLKRLFDIIVSLLVCLTILPLLYLILGAIIKLTSSGPIIFRQKRIGIYGHRFVCYKFRSMYENSIDRLAIKGDERVTPVGKFIRKTHLDEFPQFYNVLIGDMSIVGPRPTIRLVVEGLNNHPKYIYRELVRPGITGLSQINGRPDTQEKMIEFDFEYLRSQSLWKDLTLIFKTLQFKDESF